MPKVELKVRHLDTGEVLIAELPTETDARDWLIHRPEKVEVLGVPTPYLGEEIHRMLKAVVRPLSAEERALQKALDEADARAEEERQRQQKEQDAREIEAYRESLRQADPDRPMEIRWTLDGAMKLNDQFDERPITAPARDAVLAWVAERNEWVKDRGQVVGEAIVTVWPGPLPPDGERVQRGGQFVPVPAPTG